MQKATWIISVSAIFIMALAIFILEKYSPDNTPIRTAAIHSEIGGDFTLLDQNGQIFDSKSIGNKLRLVYFGFTYCPDICPTSLHKISQVIKNLGDDAKKIVPIFITIDPERDNPAQLKSYMENFDSRIIALTGTTEEIKTVAGQYKVYFAKDDGGKDNYMINHSSLIYLVDKDGKYIKHFNEGMKAPEIAALIKEYI